MVTVRFDTTRVTLQVLVKSPAGEFRPDFIPRIPAFIVLLVAMGDLVFLVGSVG